MLLSPSRADCIIFSMDRVLVSTNGLAAALSQTAASTLKSFSSSETEENGAGHPDFDGRPYLDAAWTCPLIGRAADAAWALLLCAAGCGRKNAPLRLPSLEEWSRFLRDASRKGSLDPLPPLSAADRKNVLALFRERYLGPNGQGTAELDAPLFKNDWRKLPLPPGIYTRRSREEVSLLLKKLQWEDFPQDRIVTCDDFRKPDPAGIDAICRSFGGRWPLFLGSSDDDALALSRFGAGDFIAVGKNPQDCAARFSSAADALRAILGVI